MPKHKKVLNFGIKNRNAIFLVECFIVHAVYAVFLSWVGVYPLAVINEVSALLYMLFFVSFAKKTEQGMAVAYLEILLFAIITELSVGSGYGFYLFAVGMIACLFFLIPSYGRWRFAFQIFGAVLILIVELCIRLWGWSMPIDTTVLVPMRQSIFTINLAITMVLVVENGIFFATENDDIRERLIYNMNHDPLTDLYNRRYFEEWAHGNKNLKKGNYAIAMMDIDNFKKINDTYGHEIGDKALVLLTTQVKKLVDIENSMLGKDDSMSKMVIPVRWGGEEFIILFPNRTAKQIVPVMESFRKNISEQVIKSKDNKISYTVTIGVADGKAGSNYEKVISEADGNLYYGKKNGKNRVVLVQEG